MKENMKQSIAVENIPGRATGNIILLKTANLVHPSIIPASSSSFGIFKKKLVSIQSERGKDQEI